MDPLEKLIRKNETQARIRNRNLRFGLVGGILGMMYYFIYIYLISVLGEDRLTFLGFQIWGISRYIWLIGLSILSIILLTVLSIFILLITKLICVRISNRKSAVKVMVDVHPLTKFLMIFLPTVLVLLAQIFTDQMQLHAGEISFQFVYMDEYKQILVQLLAGVFLFMFVAVICVQLHGIVLCLIEPWISQHYRIKYTALTTEDSRYDIKIKPLRLGDKN